MSERRTGRDWSRGALALCGALAVLATGCGAPKLSVGEQELRSRALHGLKRGTEYADDPAVRAQSIEALSRTAPAEGLPYMRDALRDDEPVVRFAACMALGLVKDKGSRGMLETRLEDTDASVQTGAIYALHRLGDYRHTSRLADRLLRDPSPGVRANAAMVLGELGEKGAIRLLRHAARDRQDVVSLQAIEAMALLGDAPSFQQLTLLTHDGSGPTQVLAILALGRTGDRSAVNALVYHLRQGTYLETKLAAARGLGMLGFSDGLKVALEALDFKPGNSRLIDDTPYNQAMRVHSMAAQALGDIGDSAALPALQQRLEAQDDPRVQLAAAKAILQILGRRSAWPGDRGAGRSAARAR